MQQDPCPNRFRMSAAEIADRLGIRVDLAHEAVSITRRSKRDERGSYVKVACKCPPEGHVHYPEHFVDEYIVTVYSLPEGFVRTPAETAA